MTAEMTDEEFYDKRIAPVLSSLGAECQARGLGFFALAQYGKGAEMAVGRTVAIPAAAPAVFRYALALAQAGQEGGVNIDAFMIAVMNQARKTGHSSLILQRLGIPPEPGAKEEAEAHG